MKTLDTLDRTPLDVPQVPTVRPKLAEGGEMTYRPPKKYAPYAKMIKEGADPSEAVRLMYKEGLTFESPDAVPAEPDEYLRDADLRYVPDWSENLMHRVKVQQNSINNPDYQALQLKLCKSSITYFANTFCWTYDPRLENPHIPLVLYPFQEEMLGWQLFLIRRKEGGLVEKSRDMGATWILGAVVSAYLTLFFPGVTDYQLSLREDDVDNRSEDSLLGKYRYILRNLPDWMKMGWAEKEADIDNKMKIRIPATESKLMGQLTGGTSARGGRASRALYDEFAFIENSDSVRKASGSLTNCPVYLSTANGMGNEFYQMATDPGVNKLTLHWRLHPMKNEWWALKERSKITYTDETWAQEHEIAYETSTQGRVYPEFISFSSSEYNWSHCQRGFFYEYDENYDVYVGIDFGMADPTSVVFAQMKPAPLHFSNFTQNCLVFFDEYEQANKTVDEWAEFLKGKGYRYRHIVGDYRSGNQRDSTGNTWIKYLGMHGIHVTGKYNTEQGPIMEVKRLLARPGCIAVNADRCPTLVKAFQNWSYPVDRQSGMVKHNAGPKHDQWSHVMKATAYLVDYVYGEKRKRRNDVKDWAFKVLDNVY